MPMVSSRDTILGNRPYERYGRTPGSFGINDPGDPENGFCSASDTQGPLGTNSDRGLPQIGPDFRTQSKPAPSQPSDATGLELAVKKIKSPPVETPFVSFEIEGVVNPILIDGKANQKIKLDLASASVEMEQKLAKLSENVTLKLKLAANGPELVNCFTALIQKSDKKPLEAKLGADIQTGGAVIQSVGVYLATHQYPIHVDFGGSFPWVAGYANSDRVQWRFKITIRMRPGLQACRQLVQQLGSKFLEFINVYCRTYLAELAQAGVISAALLVASAGAITFGLVAALSSIIDKQFQAGAKLAYCITFAEAYVFYLFGRTQLGHSMLAPSSDASDPKMIDETRQRARDTMLDDVRNYAKSISAGTPWSDDFMTDMFRSKFKQTRNLSEDFDARKAMYNEILAGLKQQYGV